MVSTAKLLKGKHVIYWDFDGVIKDSLDVKSNAFYHLFLPFGPDTASKIRHHHEVNCGVSRYEKIPIYLNWANQSTAPENIGKYADLFGKLVKQSVINSPWVPGVLEYLKQNYTRQKFILVTATPQSEILDILDELGISHCFCDVYGSPHSKKTVITSTLKALAVCLDNAVMIGDSQKDLEAASSAKIDFILRRTHGNTSITHPNVIDSFDDLSLSYN